MFALCVVNMDSQTEALPQTIAPKLSKCDYCGKTYSNLYWLNKHVKVHKDIDVHREQLKHQCDYCGKTYSSIKCLNRHVKVHKEQLKHQCSMCDKKFMRTYTLKRHVETRHMRMQQYECEHCGATFCIKGNLKKHFKDIHPTDPDILALSTKCTLCDCYFKTKIHLSHHMMKSHRKHVKQKCSKNTKTMKVQGKDDQCCPDDLLAAALEKSGLDLIPEPDIITVDTATINGKKYVKCDMCEYRSVRFSALERHMVSHRTTKPYKCPSCDMRYKYCSDLRVHLKDEHDIKCKSNNNKTLLNEIIDLNSVVSSSTCKNKKEKNKCVEGEKITMKSQMSEKNDTHIVKIQVHIPKDIPELEADENVNGLSMPILDDESNTNAEVNKEILITPKQLANQPLLRNNYYYQNDNSPNQKNFSATSSNINILNINDTASVLPQNHLATSTEITNTTNVLRDALLGQANVPLIDKVKSNTPNVLQTQTSVCEQNETEVEPYILNYTNGGVVYELSGDLYSECELGDENILKITGSVDGPVNPEFNKNSINDHVLVSCAKEIKTWPEKYSLSNSPIVEQEILSDLSMNYDICNIIQQNEITPSEPLNNVDNEIEKYLQKYVGDSNQPVQFIRNATAEIKEADKENSVQNSKAEKNADPGCKLIYSDENILELRPEFSLENIESNEKLLNTKMRKAYNYDIDLEKLPSYMDIQRTSELSTSSVHNADIDINECNFDVSFDINELSFETSNVNISLTDIVKDMGSQSDIQQNISIDRENDFLQNWNKRDKSNKITEETNGITEIFISNVNVAEVLDTGINSTTGVSNTDIYLANIDLNDSIRISSENYLTEKTTTTQFPLLEDIDMNKDKTYADVNESTIAQSSDMSTDDISLTNIDIQVINFGFNMSSEEAIHKVHECIDDSSTGNIHFETSALCVNDVNNDAFTEQVGKRVSVKKDGAAKNKESKSSKIQDVTDKVVTEIIPSQCMLGISSSNKEKETAKDIDDNAVITSNLLENESSFYIPVHNDEHFSMNEPDLHLTINPQLISYVADTETESSVLNNTAYGCLKSVNNNEDTTAESLINNLEPDYTIEVPIPAHTECNVPMNVLKRVLKVSQNYEHKCKVCVANFKRSFDLKRHQLTHKPKNILLCDLCGKTVSSKSAMKTHLKIHNSDKLLCWICGILVQEISFKRHKCVSKYQPKCPLCDRTFFNAPSLKRHILNYHDVFKRKGRENRLTEDLVNLIDELNEEPS